MDKICRPRKAADTVEKMNQRVVDGFQWVPCKSSNKNYICVMDGYGSSSFLGQVQDKSELGWKSQTHSAEWKTFKQAESVRVTNSQK